MLVRKSNSYENLIARIELVSVSLIESTEEAALLSKLSSIKEEVLSLIYKKSTVQFSHISEEKLSVIVFFYKSIMRVIYKNDRVNRELDFFCQRILFDVTFFLLSHPEYEEHFVYKFSSSNHTGLVLNQELYELALKQITCPSFSNDITAHGDWLVKVLGDSRYNIYGIRCNSIGMLDALKLWEDLCILSASRKPENLRALLLNIKSTMSKEYGQGLYFYGTAPWFDVWKSRVKNISVCISSIPKFYAAYDALNGIGSSEEWQELALSSFADPETRQNFSSIEEVVRACVNQSCLSSIYKFYGLLGLNNHWTLIQECWYMSNPEGTNIKYIESPLFERDGNTIVQMARANFRNEYWLGDERRNLNLFSLQACIVLIVEHRISEPSFSINIASSSVKEDLAFVNELLNAISVLKNNNVTEALSWKKKYAIQSYYRLKKELNGLRNTLNEKHQSFLSKCIPEFGYKSTDYDLKIKSWGGAQKRFSTIIKPWESLISNYVKAVPSSEVSLELTYNPYEFATLSGESWEYYEFEAEYLASRFINQVVFDLKNISENAVWAPMNKVIWYMPINEFINLDHNEIVTKSLNHGLVVSSEDEIKLVRSNVIVGIEVGAIELKVFEWPAFPWSDLLEEGVMNLVYGFIEFKEQMHVNLTMHYGLEVLNERGIIVKNVG